MINFIKNLFGIKEKRHYEVKFEWYEVNYALLFWRSETFEEFKKAICNEYSNLVINKRYNEASVIMDFLNGFAIERDNYIESVNQKNKILEN